MDLLVAAVPSEPKWTPPATIPIKKNFVVYKNVSMTINGDTLFI
jgi:hypothetical protein